MQIGKIGGLCAARIDGNQPRLEVIDPPELRANIAELAEQVRALHARCVRS